MNYAVTPLKKLGKLDLNSKNNHNIWQLTTTEKWQLSNAVFKRAIKHLPHKRIHKQTFTLSNKFQK
jgi:hypothetical protein